MSNQPDSDHQPQPEAEPLIEEQRSAGQAALQAAEIIGTGAGLTLGGLAAKDAYGQAKDKLGLGGSKSDDSKD